MTFDSLNDFIEALDGAGELVRVRHPVSVDLELCEIADRVMKMPGGGPALLFEHPLLIDGGRSAFPVGINLFGSMRRMCMALGVDDLNDIGRRISELLEMKVPEGFVAKLALLPRLMEVAKFPPRVSRGSPTCQEIIWRGEEVNLGRLPLMKCWPEDGGPYITFPMVITRDPVRGIRNVGLYRIMQTGRNTVAMHWQRHKVGAAHWREMADRGERMPVCIAIGADPASMYSASAPLPPTVDEFLFAGFLRRNPVKLTKATTCDLEVPADADFVLEGYIDPAEPLVTEGPFGDHTGFYSLADLYPQVHLTAITMRKNPVFAATIVGRPPMEDYYLGHATERIFLPLLRLTVPEIVDYHMPAEGIFHNLVFVSIDKHFPGQAYKVMNALWGQGLMSLAKLIVVVDKWVDVRNPQEAWWVALNHIDPERDVRFTMGPVDVLDHASRAFTYGSKMGIDATRKLPEEGFTRDWPAVIEMDGATKQRVDEMWEKLGIGARAGALRTDGRRAREGAPPLPVDDTAARVAGR
jgi:4-hydroxy-3-polyprenylbenzoate decarboxylase